MRRSRSPRPGNVLAMDGITKWWSSTAITHSTVREPGDYAVARRHRRLYPPGIGDPVRLDFFGEPESIRSFDPERSARPIRCARSARAVGIPDPVETIRAFAKAMSRRRQRVKRSVYEAITEGRRHPGMEHWLALFHGKLDTLVDYVAARRGARAAREMRRRALRQIADYYRRAEALEADRAGTI